MARTELPNGVILPAEYSDDWYEDMTSNLTKLDDVIGSDSEKLNADGVDFLRMSSAVLTDGGTGNFSDLNSSYKIKTGDLILDSGRKLYKIVSVNSTTETFTVGNSLFKVTAESDLATVATSGDYDDLSNKPTINDSTITIQKNGSTVDTFTTNGSDKTIDITVPTKTSDLTNDSNFVDTSNPAVSSGITSAKVTDYDTHIADTDIHVTASDKTTWNTVTSKAQDSDVVHKSGSETITGIKTITDTSLEFKSTSAEYGVSAGDSSVIFRDKNNLQTFKIYSRVFFSGIDNNLVSFFLTQKVDNTYYTSNGIQLLANTGSKDAILRPILANNNADGLSVSLGDSNRRWQSVYANNYYYGSNNVEFSTKFVTTDTNQTISGNKTFSSNVNVYNSDSTSGIANLILRNQKAEKGGSLSDSQNISFTDNLVRNLAVIRTQVGTNGQTILQFRTDSIDGNNADVYSGFSIISYKNGIKAVSPYSDGNISLGTTNSKWSSVQTNKINSLEPSSLSLPSDRSARIDISSYITNLGNGDNNQYIVPANGYIWLHFTSINSALCYAQTSGGLTNYAQTFTRYSGDGQLYAFFPVRKNDYFIVQIYTASTAVVQNAYFIPCQGNV